MMERWMAMLMETSLWEWVAVMLAIIYVLLAAYRHIACWFFGILSSLIYVGLAFTNQIYMDAGLQIFYVILGFYGWYTWRKTSALDISEWSLKKHAFAIVVTTIIGLILAWFFARYTDQENPILDALITTFSLFATYLVSKKILSNWIYWIVIDAFAAQLFASRALHLTACLYLIYSVIAGYGFYQWYRIWKKH